MIELDRARFVDVRSERRAVLDSVSFQFSPGIWHLEATPAGDARTLIGVVAGHVPLAGGATRRHGLCSWPLSQVATLGAHLNGGDLVDLMASLHDLDPRGTTRFFRDMLDEPALLGERFDRWPQAAQRQFTHTAILAPTFDNYLIDMSPVLSDSDFYRRWRALFAARTDGKTVLMASGGHRAARRDFPGTILRLSHGVLRPAPEPVAPLLLAAE